MDIIDNIMFAQMKQPLNSGPILSDFIPNLPQVTPILSSNGVYNYDQGPKFEFCAYDDATVIEQSILRHWYDVAPVPTTAIVYQSGGDTYSDFTDITPYHLIYAYLLENTRMVQIFEKVVEKYM